CRRRLSLGGRIETLLGLQFEESFRGEVGAVRPADGAADRVQGHAREVGGSSQRLEDRPFEQREEIDPLRRPIVEVQAQRMRATDLSLTDAKDHRCPSLYS